jgi:hypothetical protein
MVFDQVAFVVDEYLEHKVYFKTHSFRAHIINLGYERILVQIDTFPLQNISYHSFVGDKIVVSCMKIYLTYTCGCSNKTYSFDFCRLKLN